MFTENTSEVEVSFYKDNEFYLQDLWTPEEDRRKGQAQRLMLQVTAWADENKAKLILTVESGSKELTEEDLFSFYGKYGFTRQPFLNSKTAMIREAVS